MEIPEVNKKEVEFPGVTKEKLCGISEGKVTNLKIPGVFRRVCSKPPPFWEKEKVVIFSVSILKKLCTGEFNSFLRS